MKGRLCLTNAIPDDKRGEQLDKGSAVAFVWIQTKLYIGNHVI